MRSHGLSPPRRRALGLALGVGIVVAAIIVVVLAFGGSDHGSGNARGPVTITVDLAHRGPDIPRSFLGLSIEYQSVRPYFGTGARPNLAFLRRVAALGRAQRSPVALRIGGNSSDESWWNPTHRPRPHGVLFDIGPDWAASLARGQAQLGAPLALGLNLALNDPGNGLALVRAVRSRLKRPGLVALEIGNEPDLFVRARTFRVGRLVVHRPRQRLRYGPMRYMVEARRYIAAVSAGLDPAAPRLAIGGFATPAFLRALPALVDPPNSRVGELMAHSYPLTTCNPAVPAGDLRARLLTDDASRGLTDALTPYFATARRKGLPVRVSELNSAVCGGVAGVSDTFAAALWAPDTLFAMARRGVRQVDVHTWAGAYYAPLTVGRRARGHEVAHPRPLYFGLMLFALAAPAGSRLVPVRIGNAGATRAWATVDRSGVVRLLIINRSSTASRDIRVRIPGAGRLGRLTLLRAPGIGARGGVTLGGRDLASSAAARPPLGSPVSMRGGRGRFTLPAPSAALLTVRATGT